MFVSQLIITLKLAGEKFLPAGWNQGGLWIYIYTGTRRRVLPVRR